MLRALVILAALALPTRAAEPLLKWIEPSRVVRHHGIEDWFPDRYFVFETYFDFEWCIYRFRQREVPPWEWDKIKIPPQSEDEEE
jgi:hypothetical protein